MKRTFLGLLLAIATAAGFAADRGTPAFLAPPSFMSFRSYGADQGLTTPSITSLAQDAAGFFWVGTEDGLFRLEGDRFRRFDEANGLPASGITTNGLSPGRSQGLWVSTNRGLVFWDGLRFRRPSEMGVQGLDERPSVCLPQGGAILSDQPTNTRYFSLDGENFQPLTGLPWGEGLTAATYYPPKDLLLVGLRGILWTRQGKGAWVRRELGPALGGDLRALWVDEKDQVWIRSTEHLARLENLTAPLVRVPTPIPLSVVNDANLGVDGFGRVWTNSTQGIIWIDGNTSGVIGPKEGLPQGGAAVLCVDQQSNLWIGGDGCHKLLGQGLWAGWTQHQGLPTDVVWTLARTRDGLMWAGTAGGLAVSDGRGWKTLPGTRANQIMSLSEDPDGNLWVGHLPSRERPGGFAVRARGSLVLQPVSVPGLAAESSVTAVLAEKDVVWVGTSRIGLLRAERCGLSLKFDPTPQPIWPNEKFVGINRLVSDGRGGLWVVSSNGMAHWDGKSWAALDKSTGLPDGNMVTLAATPNGEAWGAFREVSALVNVRRKGDRLEILETLHRPHPLLKSTVIILHCQPDGRLWVGTSRGLLRWDGRRVERFGRHTGLPGEDCAQNALWFDPNGDVWVGLSVGIARGQLGRISGDQTPPAAQIISASRGDGQSLLADAKTRLVPWPFRTLTFEYGPKGTLRTEDLVYQVRLVGLEDAWRETALTEARYPGLGAGKYRFEVRTVNSVGETGPAQGLDVQVRAPWWMRPWFLALEALALAGLAFLALRWRLRLLQKRNEHLEALVHARTQELETANQSLLEASLVDPLTGLHNRRFLTMTMPEEEVRLHRMFRLYLQRGESPLCRNEDLVLFLCDLDHFKRVNDTYGHAAGDQVLQEAAQLLRGVSRTSDTLVRWGGEEFLLVAKRSDRTKAHQIAEKLCQAVRSHTFVLSDGRTLRCSLSVGFAAFPILDQLPEVFSWEDTLQGADQCLYAAKHAGRDGWVGVHTPGPVDSSELGSRFRVDLEGLVQEGKILVASSFPEGSAFAKSRIISGHE